MTSFDFTRHMRLLCADIVARLDAFGHIDLDRVAIRFCQTRRQGPYGVQASLTPMRFAGGSVDVQKRGKRYTVEPIRDPIGREMLYLLSFYLPRFFDRPLHDKLNTVIHELWHIGPSFDGDIRRHKGRCYAHSSSQKNYDGVIERLTAQWLALHPPEDLFAFLRLDFRGLMDRYGKIFGTRIRTPKLVPVVRKATCRSCDS
jgi:hypothetical protein